MIRLALALAVVTGCHAPPSASPDAPTGDAAATGDAVVPTSFGELCGNGIDDDGDGLVDEDCPPSLFAGVYAPGVASDPALAAIEAATGRPLAILQTYHSTSATGVARIAPDLAAIFARGQVAHLNIEPAGYTAAQYAAPAAAPLSGDLRAMAAQVTTALVAAPTGRVLLTFGAEMNGNWTDWGCLPAAQYIALYRAAHAAVDAALAGAQLDPRRVRWAYGPNATASASCGSAAGYYPGEDVVDLLGMSGYRSGTTSVAEAVIAPMAALFDALAMPAAERRDRFVLLQTGSRAVPGDDRDAWIRDLFTTLTADPRVAGVIWFDAADWAIATHGAGWAGLTSSIAGAPVADRGLDGIFAPYFRDVAYGDPGFGEIQYLRATAITSGCSTSPARFCPDALLSRADAISLLARSFPAGPLPAIASDPVTESDLVAALAAIGRNTLTAAPIPATRARAAVLIAHAK